MEMCIRDRGQSVARSSGNIDLDIHLIASDGNGGGSILADGLSPVSYTHLDVYKRQVYFHAKAAFFRPRAAPSVLTVGAVLTPVSYTHLGFGKNSKRDQSRA